MKRLYDGFGCFMLGSVLTTFALFGSPLLDIMACRGCDLGPFGLLGVERTLVTMAALFFLLWFGHGYGEVKT
jgi:hypothetical protein